MMGRNLTQRHQYRANPPTSSSCTSSLLTPIKEENEVEPNSNSDTDTDDDDYNPTNYHKANISPQSIYFKHRHWLLVLALTLLGTVTRLYDLKRAAKPIWDEVHFGKYGSHYLQRTFYHDVHPPLGKLLVALGGYVAGYDGSFVFNAIPFPDGMRYEVMRATHALFGILIIPLTYLTLHGLKLPTRSCLLGASMILFDNGFTVISRFVLLDSLLLFCLSLSVYFLVGFGNVQDQPFTKVWWGRLFGLGISLGLGLSVKWIGLFVIILVGLYTVEDLWNKFGDYHMPKVNQIPYIYIKY